jgi:hypothetical protein
MCCFIMTVGFFGPRLGFLVFWLIAPLRVNTAFNTFIWPLLGLIFLPWATLAYVVLFPMTSFDWVIFALAVALDIATWAGGGSRRRAVPGYPSSAP